MSRSLVLVLVLWPKRPQTCRTLSNAWVSKPDHFVFHPHGLIKNTASARPWDFLT